MLLIVAFLLGAVAGGALAYAFKPAPAPKARPVSDADRRRAERAMREYRNFLTYDGFSRQEDQS